MTLAVAWLALVAAGCGGDRQQALARVNGEAVTASQLDERVSFFQIIYRHQMSSQEIERLRPQFVDMLVDEAVLTQEAKKRGLTPQAGAVRAETARVLEAIKIQNYNGSEEQMKRGLKQAGLTEEILREIVARQLAVDSLFRQVTAPVKVADADLRAYYDRNKAQMVRPETVRLAHIQAKTKEDADKALAELRAGKPFTEVAQSVDPMVAAHGGMSINGVPPAGAPQEVRRGQLPPELEKAAFELAAGQVSPVVESQGSYFILKVEDKQAARQMTFDEVKAGLRADLLQEKQKETFERFIADIKKSAKIQRKKDAGA